MPMLIFFANKAGDVVQMIRFNLANGRIPSTRSGTKMKKTEMQNITVHFVARSHPIARHHSNTLRVQARQRSSGRHRVHKNAPLVVDLLLS